MPGFLFSQNPRTWNEMLSYIFVGSAILIMYFFVQWLFLLPFVDPGFEISCLSVSLKYFSFIAFFYMIYCVFLFLRFALHENKMLNNVIDIASKYHVSYSCILLALSIVFASVFCVIIPDFSASVPITCFTFFIFSVVVNFIQLPCFVVYSLVTSILCHDIPKPSKAQDSPIKSIYESIRESTPTINGALTFLQKTGIDFSKWYSIFVMEVSAVVAIGYLCSNMSYIILGKTATTAPIGGVGIPFGFQTLGTLIFLVLNYLFFSVFIRNSLECLGRYIYGSND